MACAFRSPVEPMHPRPMLILTLLLLPTASASDASTDTPDALAIGRITDTDQVQLTITLGGQHRHGEILPLCQGAPPMREGFHVLGVPDDTCFHILHIDTPDQPGLVLRSSTTSASTVIVGGVGPAPVCGPVGVSILPHGGPPVYVEPDEACINAIINEVLG